MQPLISIIIPTKDRYRTLIPVIESICEFITPDMEIVIQDNSADNKCILNNKIFRSNNIKYFYEKKTIPISENTSLAIENSTGKYLLFIGDDDFVSPFLLSIVKEMERAKCDCLIYNGGYYWWDSVKFASKDYYRDKMKLTVPQNASFEMKKLYSVNELNRVLNNGATGYYYLPRFYHGIVKRECLCKIKEVTGRYLNGSCPDIAFAVSLSMVISEYYFMNYPVTIFGASEKSGGGLTANKSHYKKIEEATFLRSDIVEKWDSNIPKIWSQITIYPQTTREVLDAFGAYGLHINYLCFYASMFLYEPYLKKYLNPLIIKNTNNIKSKIIFLNCLFKKMAGLMLQRMHIFFHSKKQLVFSKVPPSGINAILRTIK